MTDYTELVKALRETATFTQTNGTLSKRECALENLAYDAAAAIEELQAQLPKRGEWIPYEFNTNGTWHKCSVCGVAYQYKDAPNSGWWINHKYCPNCGAKMEVQE